MKSTTKYVSYDGVEFYTEQECMDYEALAQKITALVDQLTPRPDSKGTDFENGGGYIQHDKETFLKVRAGLCEIANGIFEHKWFAETIKKGMAAHESYAGRVISEIGNKCLRNAWGRMACTDDLFREWGQPYFANHDGKGAKKVCIGGVNMEPLKRA